MSVDQLGKYNDDGTSFGKDASEKIAFHGATPIVQQADASQVAITDNSTGTVGDTIAAGAGVYTLNFPMALKEITDGDFLTDYTIGHKFKLLSFGYVADVESSTSSKASTITLEIGATGTTGGSLALTTALTDTTGKVTAATAITALNTGSSSATISIIGASTTAFAEGSGSLQILVQNMDTADAIASLADKWNELRSVIATIGLMSGAA